MGKLDSEMVLTRGKLVAGSPRGEEGFDSGEERPEGGSAEGWIARTHTVT